MGLPGAVEEGGAEEDVHRFGVANAVLELSEEADLDVKVGLIIDAETLINHDSSNRIFLLGIHLKIISGRKTRYWSNKSAILVDI